MSGDPLNNTKPVALPGSVLFLCGMNAIRSPMAEALAKSLLPRSVYVQSAGVREGQRDPFVDTVMDEIGLKISDSSPRDVADLDDGYFDLIITLAPEAHHLALKMNEISAGDVEYWPTADPSIATGSRESILQAYRDARSRIADNIRSRFGLGKGA